MSFHWTPQAYEPSEKKTKIKSDLKTPKTAFYKTIYKTIHIVMKLCLPQGKNPFSPEVNRRLNFEYRESTQRNNNGCVK